MMYRVNQRGQNRKKLLNKFVGTFVFVFLTFANIFPVITLAEGEDAPAAPPAPVQTETAPVAPVTDPAPVDPTPVTNPTDPTPLGSAGQATPTDPTPIPTTTETSTPATTSATTSDSATILPQTESSTPATADSGSTTDATTTLPQSSGSGGEDIGTTTSATTTDATTTNGTSTPITGFQTSGTSTPPTSTIIIATDTLLKVASPTDPNATDTLPGPAVIDTGDAKSTANILNILNTNSVNSTGTIQMANLVDGHDGSMDFRGGGGGGGGGGSTCTVLACQGVESVTANILSGASIDNSLVLQAGTGSNTAQTADMAAINTGDAFAGLNLVNLANTNFIDSNYFLLSLNSFKTINGDIVLPALEKFLPQILSAYENLNINTQNSAILDNSLDVDANSGNNASENTLNALTNTGSAKTSTNVYNNVNSNLFGGRSVAVLLRVTGKWLGKFLGIPEELADQAVTHDGDTYLLKIEDGQTPTIVNTKDLNLAATNTAEILNHIKILANSGNNLTKDTNTSFINTGDALAAANVVNIANTNIVGKNWMLAIINILGDFNGNIIFGRPDIAVSMSVDPVGVINNGTSLLYHMKVWNKGDRTAKNVLVKTNFDPSHLALGTVSAPYDIDSTGGMLFNVGTLAPNEVKTISYGVTVQNAPAGTQIVNTSTGSLDETDGDMSDNVGTIALNTYAGGGSNYVPTIDPNQQIQIDPNLNATNTGTTTPDLAANNFQIIRDTVTTFSTARDQKVHQKVTVRNLVNKAVPNVTFNDYIFDPQGKQIQKQTWDLGIVNPNEDIELTYDITFGPDAVSGSYKMGSEILYGNQRLQFLGNGTIALNLPPETVAENLKTNLNQKLQIGSPTLAINNLIDEMSGPTMVATDTASSTLTGQNGNGQTPQIESNGTFFGFNAFDSKKTYSLLLMLMISFFATYYIYTFKEEKM